MHRLHDSASTRLLVSVALGLAGCHAPGAHHDPLQRQVFAPRAPSVPVPRAVPTRGPAVVEAPRTASQVLDLEQARRLALAKNPGLRAAEERWQAARARPAAEGALPEPQLTWRHFVEEVETRVGPQRQALGLRQKLPWPGRRGARSAAAEAEADVQHASFAAAGAELLQQVDSIWFDAYDLERSIAVVERNRDLFVVLEEALRRRYAAGEGPLN